MSKRKIVTEAKTENKEQEITADYINAVCNAMKFHNSCRERGIPEMLSCVLKELSSRCVRQPNDWSPEGFGGFSMKWHDGKGGVYDRGKRSIIVNLFPDETPTITISGYLPDGKINYASENSMRIPGLTVSSALDMIVVLVSLVDKPIITNNPNLQP